MCSSKKVHQFESPLSGYAKSLDLSALPDNVPERVMEKLLRRVERGLEVFVAPNAEFSRNCLAALSKCHNLVRLDLSLIDPSFSIIHLLTAISMLSCLKVFHYPHKPAYFPDSDSEMSDNGGLESPPKWPNSLETIHIPCSLDLGYLLVLGQVPASLSTLVIENGFKPFTSLLDLIFTILDQQIQTLKVKYEEEWSDLLEDILDEFPNLLDLILRPCFISDGAVADIDLGTNQSLRSITVYIDQLDDIFDPELLKGLQDLVDKDQLPNIKSLVLSSELLVDDWASFLRGKPLPVEYLRLLEIGKRLKRRGSSGSGLKESGVWLVDGEDHDGVICEFTEENLENLGAQL